VLPSNHACGGTSQRVVRELEGTEAGRYQFTVQGLCQGVMRGGPAEGAVTNVMLGLLVVVMVVIVPWGTAVGTVGDKDNVEEIELLMRSIIILCKSHFVQELKGNLGNVKHCDGGMARKTPRPTLHMLHDHTTPHRRLHHSTLPQNGFQILECTSRGSKAIDVRIGGLSD
jgi:hypothetical protein